MGSVGVSSIGLLPPPSLMMIMRLLIIGREFVAEEIVCLLMKPLPL